MGKISKQISQGLSAAIQEVQNKIVNEQENTEDNTPVSFDVNVLLNMGVETHNKRKKKAEEVLPEDAGFKRGSFTHDEVCDNEIQRAHEKGLPDPDFDFRNFYEPGHKAWYVHVSEVLGEKEVVPVTLRTIYARTVIASEDKGLCHCVGYNQRNNIFESSRDAQTFCDSLVLNAKYKPELKKVKDVMLEEDDDNYVQTGPNLDDD